MRLRLRFEQTDRSIDRKTYRVPQSRVARDLKIRKSQSKRAQGGSEEEAKEKEEEEEEEEEEEKEEWKKKC